jgi:hypothetical protein
MSIPSDFEKNITSYKITLYESEKPIGETGTEGLKAGIRVGE